MELPAVAGHTLTARRGLSLLLVGGYSPENGFNQQLLEYQLATGTWVSGAQSGTPPTGEAAVEAVWTVCKLPVYSHVLVTAHCSLKTSCHLTAASFPEKLCSFPPLV